MARPRKASDDQIFEAVYRVMQRRGPAEWTLADVAAEGGLTAGALVQRFGSKHRLQLALIERFADAGPEMYAALRARHRSPVAALRAYAAELACMAASRQELAHHLDYLRLDLSDPQMHVHFRRHAESSRRFITQCLREAVEQRMLRSTVNVARLARLVDAVVSGSLFTWAAYDEGQATVWMRRNLDDLLSAYEPQRPRRAGR